MAEKIQKKRGEKEACVMTSEAGIHLTRRPATKEAGQVLLIVTLAMVVFLGFLALAADVGYWRYVKRNMQKSADAGAIGGASELVHSGNVDFAVNRDTSKNGFTNGEKGVEVTWYIPPRTGPHKDLTDADHYVEVIIAQPQPTFFAKIFGRTSQMVTARAVAYGGLTPDIYSDGCIFTLDRDSENAFHVSGENTSVEADCNILVNSNNDNCALKISGNSTVHATGIAVVGEWCIEGSGTDVDPSPETYDGEVTDPLKNNITLPNFDPNNCTETDLNIKEDSTLQPGVYCGGIRISSSGLKVNFQPGLYVLYNGGFNMHSGGSTLLGQDVTFYNTGDTNYGAITINANAGTDLSATLNTGFPQGSPPSVPGVLFWQDPNNTREATFNGNSDTIMEGAYYFPEADVKFNGGNSTETGYAVVVAQNVKFSGSATFHIENDTSGSGGGSGGGEVVAKILLVE